MIQVAAGIVTRPNRVLVCQRPLSAAHGGKWEFPGGKREPGETLQECLRRELREELAIAAAIGTEVWRTKHTYPGREPLELFFFHVPRYTGRLSNRVFAAVRWLPPGRLATLDFLAADRGLVSRLGRGQLELSIGGVRDRTAGHRT
jgi:8-oxo-dGTP diphosphatase